MRVPQRLIDYLSAIPLPAWLTITQGRLAGEPFPVFPWQRRFVQGAFAPEVIEAALIADRGRNNGNTTLITGGCCAWTPW